VATKEQKRQAQGLIGNLEIRMQCGPPVHETEIHSVREFLRQHEFSPASDYFIRLAQLQHRRAARAEPILSPGKRNYGGEAGGSLMQVQSIYDHLILSTCYEGEFNCRRGRVKISHRFNQAGRVDFVELKFLRALHPALNGELRKLVLVKGYQSARKDWRTMEAFVLPVLPRELVCLYSDIFRCPRNEMFAWLINIGHRLMGDLLEHLRAPGETGNQFRPREAGEQACLTALKSDVVAWPIIQKAAALESAVDIQSEDTIAVRYLGTATESVTQSASNSCCLLAN
jgi:hypothetical protein